MIRTISLAVAMIAAAIYFTPADVVIRAPEVAEVIRFAPPSGLKFSTTVIGGGGGGVASTSYIAAPSHPIAVPSICVSSTATSGMTCSTSLGVSR